MDKQDIISSGLLELHAAGLTSPEEASMVEQWLAEYPEVAEEYAAIESGLEAYATSNAVHPSPSVKEKIFERINADQNGRVVSMKNSPAAVMVNAVPSIWRSAAAAAVLLLLGSVVLNLVHYNEPKSREGDR